MSNWASHIQPAIEARAHPPCAENAISPMTGARAAGMALSPTQQFSFPCIKLMCETPIAFAHFCEDETETALGVLQKNTVTRIPL